MLTTVEGIYRNGQVELMENPNNLLEGTRVIVTFLEIKTIDLASQGIDKKSSSNLANKSSHLRRRLEPTFRS
jgi:hypothetical protein